MRARILAAVIGVGACLALEGDGAAAGAAPPMANELAAGAVVALEVEDLGAGLKRWRHSSVRAALERTAALEEMQKSRIFRKLSARATRLDEILGFELTLDRLILAAGRRAALGLYDVSDTRFVVIAETTAKEAERSPLWAARSRMERREHAGVSYFLVPETPRRSGAALALVGTRLVFGNDEKAFRQTLLLGARGAGVATRQAPGAALGDEPRYRRLLAASPRDLFARVFVDQARLSGTPQFDKRWIFDVDVARKVDAALLGVRFERDATVETRVYAFAPGTAAPPLAAPPAGVAFSRSDLRALVESLPAVPFGARRPTDAADAARRLAGLCGSAERADVERLRGVLAAARPTGLLEVADPAPRQGLRAHDRSGVTLLLASPGGLDAAALEAALAAARLRGLDVASGPSPAFAEDGGARVLRLPLVAELAVTVRRAGADGAALIVATDPELAARLHASHAAAAPRLAAPMVAALRLDLRQAGAHLGDVTRLLGARANWPARDARFYSESVAGLPAAFASVRDLVVIEYAAGGLHLVEAHYREGP
jgi:hypothetical protein